MSDKTATYVQGFEDWRGLDQRSSHLTRPQNAAVSMKNLEVLENFSLRGRKGVRLINNPLGRIYGQHSYRFFDANSLHPTEGIHQICVGTGKKMGASSPDRHGEMYKSVVGYFVITRTAGDTSWGYSVERKSDNTGLEFVLTQGGATALTVALGTGYEATPVCTIYSLVSQIDALANFSAAFSTSSGSTITGQGCGVVNGNQTLAGTPMGALTVDAGHSFEVGDYLIWETANGLFYAEVIATTATTVTPVMVTAATTAANRTFTDNQVVGTGIFSAAILDRAAAFVDTETTKSVSWRFWQPIPHAMNNIDSDIYPFDYFTSDVTDIEPCSFVTHRECVYVASKGIREYISVNILISSTGETLAAADDRLGLYKYDGKDSYLAGLPEIRFSSIAGGVVGAGGAFNSAGTCRAKLSLLYRDYRGNIIERFNGLTKEVEVAVGDDLTYTYVPITLAVTSIAGVTHTGAHFNLRGAYANNAGTQSGLTFTVDAAAGYWHTLRTGHFGYVRDNGGTLRRFRVSAYASTSITIEPAELDGSSWTTITVANNAVFSTMLYRAWRTTANNTTFYLAYELPADPWAVGNATTTFTTVTDDDALGEELLESEFIPYGFPKARAVAVHQGALVSGGGVSAPRTVHIEDLDQIELSPRAAFNEAVPSSYGGDVSQIVSTDTALVVFTQKSFFFISGDVPNRQYEIGVASEGGRGAGGPVAALFAEDRVFGVGSYGPFMLDRNTIVRDYGKEVSPSFIEPGATTLLDRSPISHATSVHDPQKHRLMFIVPKVEYNSSAGEFRYDLDATDWYVYDWLNQIWYEWDVLDQAIPTAGAIWHDDVYGNRQRSSLYFSSNYYGDSRWLGFCHRICDREAAYYPLGATIGSGALAVTESHDFTDQHSSYTWELSPQWDYGDSPSDDKFWQDYKLYMMQPSFWIGAFSVLLQTYRNFATSVVNSTRTLTFSASTDSEQGCKLNANTKARALLFNLSGTIDRNPPVITGYEYTVMEKVYEKEGLRGG